MLLSAIVVFSASTTCCGTSRFPSQATCRLRPAQCAPCLRSANSTRMICSVPGILFLSGQRFGREVRHLSLSEIQISLVGLSPGQSELPSVNGELRDLPQVGVGDVTHDVGLLSKPPMPTICSDGAGAAIARRDQPSTCRRPLAVVRASLPGRCSQSLSGDGRI